MKKIRFGHIPQLLREPGFEFDQEQWPDTVRTTPDTAGYQEWILTGIDKEGQRKQLGTYRRNNYKLEWVHAPITKEMLMNAGITDLCVYRIENTRYLIKDMSYMKELFDAGDREQNNDKSK
jgi:hypothetical protein